MAKERQTERRRLEDEQKRNARKEVFSWVRMFAIVIVVVFVLTQFIIINAKIPSGSMENTIMTHDPVSYTHLDVYKRQIDDKGTG